MIEYQEDDRERAIRDVVCAQALLLTAHGDKAAFHGEREVAFALVDFFEITAHELLSETVEIGRKR